MALDFGDDTNSYYVATTTLGSWNWAAGKGTILVWLWKDANHNGSEYPCMVSKSSATPINSRFFLSYNDNRNLEFLIGGTNNLNIISTNCVWNGEWICAAVVWDGTSTTGTDQRLYHGNIGTPIAECSYGTQKNGNVGLHDSSGVTLSIGINNYLSTSGEFDGKIAIIKMWNGVQLSLADLLAEQYEQRIMTNHSYLAAHYICGYHGASALPDLSGNGHNGSSFNGIIVSDHVPLGPPFGFDDGARVSCAPIIEDMLYSKGNYATLPTDDSKLEDSFTCEEYAIVES